MVTKLNTGIANSNRRSRTRTHRFAAAFALALPLLSWGCAHVAPYERGYLARPSMNFEVEAREAEFKSHVYDARVGASGGTGTSGGGCGCN